MEYQMEHQMIEFCAPNIYRQLLGFSYELGKIQFVY